MLDGVKGKMTTFHSITVDGEEGEFLEGLTDLHTRSYEEIIGGRSFGVDEMRPSIHIVSTFRTAHIVKSNVIRTFAQRAVQR